MSEDFRNHGKIFKNNMIKRVLFKEKTQKATTATKNGVASC